MTDEMEDPYHKPFKNGNNRADLTYIPGGIAPGNNLMKPDFYETNEDWPDIWYQNGFIVDGCAGYIYLATMVNNLLNESGK